MGLTVMQDGSERIHYRDPSIPIYVSRGDLSTFPGMAALCHWHEDAELLLPLKGHLAYSVNGQRADVPEGGAIFVNARQMHYGYSADGTNCRYVCVTFRPQLLCACEEIAKRYVLPVLTSPGVTHIVLRPSDPACQPVLDAIRRLDALGGEDAPGVELEQLSCIFTLWRGLYQLCAGQLSGAASADANVLTQRRMLEFIRLHFGERITLEDIAASGGVCRTRCCQLFKRYLNRTPNDYLNSFRLEKGMELLRETDMTITEIADACGFCSSSYFTELFTRQKGLPPSAYRKHR